MEPRPGSVFPSAVLESTSLPNSSTPDMASVRQGIRFCTSRDGARGAYATLGKGLPLVKAAHWLSHLEFDVTSPVWRHWLSELGRQRTFVRYDQRGRGLSDRDVEDFSFEAWVADLERPSWVPSLVTSYQVPMRPIGLVLAESRGVLGA